MFAFYAIRGYKLDELADLGGIEKAFLQRAREQYYEEKAEFITQVAKAIFGEKRG